MTRINLRINQKPSSAEIFVKIRRKDGEFEWLFAVIDTGAEVSLFPKSLLQELDYQLTGKGSITIDQAGIAKQSFEAIEARIKLSFEDSNGHHSSELEAKVWFAETSVALIGFEGILEKATLHLSMPMRTGYLEFS